MNSQAFFPAVLFTKIICLLIAVPDYTVVLFYFIGAGWKVDGKPLGVPGYSALIHNSKSNGELRKSSDQYYYPGDMRKNPNILPSPSQSQQLPIQFQQQPQLFQNQQHEQLSQFQPQQQMLLKQFPPQVPGIQLAQFSQYRQEQVTQFQQPRHQILPNQQLPQIFQNPNQQQSQLQPNQQRPQIFQNPNQQQSQVQPNQERPQISQNPNQQQSQLQPNILRPSGFPYQSQQRSQVFQNQELLQTPSNGLRSQTFNNQQQPQAPSNQLRPQTYQKQYEAPLNQQRPQIFDYQQQHAQPVQSRPQLPLPLQPGLTYQPTNLQQTSTAAQLNYRPQSTPFWNNVERNTLQWNDNSLNTISSRQGYPPQCQHSNNGVPPVSQCNCNPNSQLNDGSQNTVQWNVGTQNMSPGISQYQKSQQFNHGQQQPQYPPKLYNIRPQNLQQYIHPHMNNGGQNIGQWNHRPQNLLPSQQGYINPINRQKQFNNVPNNNYVAPPWSSGGLDMNLPPYQSFSQQPSRSDVNFQNYQLDRYKEPPRYNPSYPANFYDRYALLLPIATPPINNIGPSKPASPSLTQQNMTRPFNKTLTNFETTYLPKFGASIQNQELVKPITGSTNKQQLTQISNGTMNDNISDSPDISRNRTKENNSMTVSQIGPNNQPNLTQTQVNPAQKFSQPKGPAVEVEKSPVTTHLQPKSFYSQDDVDAHYRRMLAHNETKQDNEFENDAKQSQWYLRQAEQILRARKKDNNPAKYMPIPDS